MNDDKPISECRKAVLITNDIIDVKEDSKNKPVGYCCYYKHKGELTRRLVNHHNCFVKNCIYLQKYDLPYWKSRDMEKNKILKKKETAKRLKQEEEALHKKWVKTAQEIADELAYPIKVKYVTKIPKKKRYILFYSSNTGKNDWYRYLDLAKLFGLEVNGKIELHNINGQKRQLRNIMNKN